MSARDDITAHFTSDTLADSLLDAFRAEVLREAADLFDSYGRTLLDGGIMAAAEAAEKLREHAGKVSPAGAEITRAAHADREPHTDSETAFKQLATAPWPRCATLIIDGQPPLIGSYGGAGMGRAPSGDALIVEPQLWFDDAPVAEDAEAGKVIEAAELTIYRASHDSIVMGLYTTREAARAQCEAEERRAWMKGTNLTFAWTPDDSDPMSPEELSVFAGQNEESVTGYVVTPLEVASEYDEEADE